MSAGPHPGSLPGGEGEVPPRRPQPPALSRDFADATLLRIYGDLKMLLAREDLDPSVRASLAEALANVSLAVQDLGLAYEMLYDLGV